MRQETGGTGMHLEAAGTDVIRDRGRNTEVDREENERRQKQGRKVQNSVWG